jgi:hypothetical protein
MKEELFVECSLRFLFEFGMETVMKWISKSSDNLKREKRIGNGLNKYMSKLSLISAAI